MNLLHTLTALLITAVLITSSAYAGTIAEAKALGDGAGVQIDNVVVSETTDITAGGFAFAVQDSTAGVTLYWGNEQEGKDFVANNNIVPGDILTLSGTNASYANLYEINGWTIDIITDHGTGPVPEPQVMTVADIGSAAPVCETYESVLIVVTNVEFSYSDQGQSFASGQNYSLYDGGQFATVRIQDDEDPLVGTTIPASRCDVTGILSAYYDTFQILPLEIKIYADIDPDIQVSTFNTLGNVYPGFSHSIALPVSNAGVSNDLNVTGLAVSTGDSDKFTLDLSAPFTVPPLGQTNINVTYTPGAALGITNYVTYQLDCNDISQSVVNITFRGYSVSNDPIAPVWINEAGINDDGVDDMEFVELCGVAGTDITGYQIQFFNGSDGSNYATHTIGSFTFTDQENGFGFYVAVPASSPDFDPKDEIMGGVNSIQNGEYDAIRLANPAGETVHLFAYQSDSCVNYYKDGIPHWADDFTPLADSTWTSNTLYKVGEGGMQPEFTWETGMQTPRAVNNSQILVPEPGSMIALFICIIAFARFRK